MTLADKLRERLAAGEVGVFLALDLARFAKQVQALYDGRFTNQRIGELVATLLAELEREVCGG